MPMADDITHYDAIEGYVLSPSCVAGSVAQLCVSTSAERFDVRVHRWGGSLDLVWSADDVGGVLQPTPPDADAAGCGWEATLDIPTQVGWRSGFYLVTMTARAPPKISISSSCGMTGRA